MNSYSKNKISMVIASQWLLRLLWCCGLLSGILPQSILDISILGICFGLLITGKLMLAYPFMLFYYRTFGLIMGVSVYRLFSLLLLFDAFIRFKLPKKVKTVRSVILFPVLVYGLYLLIVFSSYSVQRSVFCMVDILCVLFVLAFLNKSYDNVRIFFKQYVIVSIFSIISGMIWENTLIEGNEWTGKIISRFTALFEDPNYMGFFMTISIFATVILKPFQKPAVRRGIIVVIYAAILASVSMTALVVNILLWLIYLLIARKINFKVGVTCLVISVIALGLYQYGLQNPDASIVGDVAYRIQKKLLALTIGDMSAVTTSRSRLTAEHWQYFLMQPIWKQLFGGEIVNTLKLSEGFEMAAHNEYMDMLLNIGLLGTAVMLGYMLYSTAIRLNVYKKTQSEIHLFLFIVKCVWIFYAMALTLFLEFRFMLPFFI